MKDLIGSMTNTRLHLAHFAGFGDWSLDFDLVYYVLSPDYNLYTDIQQHINLGLVALLSERNVEFAFPTRTIYLERPLHDTPSEFSK